MVPRPPASCYTSSFNVSIFPPRLPLPTPVFARTQNIPHRSLALSACHNLGRYSSSFNFITTTVASRSSGRPRKSPAALSTSHSLLAPRHFHSSSPRPTIILRDILYTLGKMDAYKFPDYRLKRKMEDPTKTPLLLVACGSFSPITFLHLRMFVMAGDYVRFNTNFELVGGYLSPVSDAYKKQGLALAEHRVAMCQLAIDKASNWLMVDPWEAEKKDYQPTAIVLDHFDHEINVVRKGIDTGDGTRKPVRIALLAGADLIQTMSTPGVWSDADIDYILGRYGTLIVERSGTDIEEALASLQNYRDNIYVIQQLIQNDVSSTKIRLFLKRGMSVQYLIPAPVVEYIEQNHLFEEENRAANTETDKGKQKETASSS